MEKNSAIAALERLLHSCFLRHQEDSDLVKAVAAAGRLNDEWKELQAENQKLKEAPLQYAIYLGASPNDERDVLVGIGGARYEVRLAEELCTQAAELRPGQEVLLNQTQNVVAFRHAYVRGETAEVVSVLKPTHSAEILAVHPSADGEKSFLGKWREGEEKRFRCGPLLRQVELRRGDFVAIDPEDLDVATAKIRPRLHIKSGGSDGIVVEISDLLFEEGVRPGELVRVDTGLKFAFEKLPSRQVGGLALEEVPDVTYDDIGGLEAQVEEFRDAIELPYLQRALFTRYQLTRPKGILLYGPPGCGKTMVAKAIARSLTESIRQHLTGLEQRMELYQALCGEFVEETTLAQCSAALGLAPANGAAPLAARQLQECLAEGLRVYEIEPEEIEERLREIRAMLARGDGIRSFFLNVKGPELLDKYVGATEQRIRGIFEEARSQASYYTPVIIFFDEMEAMFRARGTGRSSDVETTIVPQFLAELDGVEGGANVLLVGATNRHELIDPAILRPGRLDVKIKINRPNRAAAADILALYLSPVLPLEAAGPPTVPAPRFPGNLTFRTAYARLPATFGEASAALPPGCDMRLARSFSQSDLARLAQLPPEETLAQARARALQAEGGEAFWGKCRRLKQTLKHGEVVERLSEFARRYQEERAFASQVDDFIRREQLAETMIEALLEWLYDASAYIRVLTRVPQNQSNSRYVFAAQDFITGAVLANIVSRAKRLALKRHLSDLQGTASGLVYDDLIAAVQQEFLENREQWAVQKLRDELGRAGEEVHMVELHLETGQLDPWSEEKPRPYRVPPKE